MHLDVIVVGLGAMGSAALYHLARRGLKVLGIDAFHPPHANGSSHGETRVIREAYFEHPAYVPLVQRAYQLWQELEHDSGEKLYLPTGGLMIGWPESTVVSGALRSAREHGLAHAILDTEEIVAKAPGLRPASGMMAVHEPRAGILFPEKCVEAHLRLARNYGALIHVGEQFSDWRVDGSAIMLRTARGVYSAACLIVAAGPWLPQLLPKFGSWLQVERQVLLWFRSPVPQLMDPAHLPIHLWEYEAGRMFYGFPDLGDGLKVAFHHQGEITGPDEVERCVRPEDVSRMRALMSQFMPMAAEAELLRGVICLYTNAPDGHFILDSLPEHPNVIVASPCSGHGFKFASAVGEVLADLAMQRRSGLDLSLFSLRRFG